MQILSLIEQLKHHDIRLWLEGEQLHFSAPASGLSEEFRLQIQHNKADIIAFLKQAQKPELAPLVKVDATQYQVLSFAQQRIAFVQALLPDSGVFHLQFAFTIHGKLDTARLEQAINCLIQQHGILRTAYTAQGQIQLAAKNIHLNLHYLDRSPDQQDIQYLLQQENQQMFKLDQGEVFRHVVYQLNEQHHLILLTIHHIAIDYPSMQLLAQQLLTYYQNPELPNKTTWQYPDYAVWQQQQDYQSELAYWQQQLDDLAPLQLANKVDASLSTHAKPIYFTINPEQTTALKQLAKQQKTSLFNVLLAIYSVLLHRFSQQKNFAIGTAVSTRLRSEFEPIIGCFTNLLTIRCEQFDGDFLSHLALISQNSLMALQQQKAPFEQVVRKLNASNQHHTSPLFQTLFSWQEASTNLQTLDDLQIQTVSIDKTSSAYELSLTIQESEQVLQGEFLYRTAVFSDALVASLKTSFIHLINAITANPSSSISQLNCLSKQDLAQQKQWSQTIVKRQELGTVEQYIEQQAAESPAVTAVKFRDQQLSYAQLNNYSNQLAHEIQSSTEQDFVAVFCQRSLYLPVVLLAILKAGKAYLPIDEDTPSQRIASILNDADINLVISDRLLCKHLPTVKHTVLNIDNFNFFETVHGNLAKQEHSSLFNLIYTSGSTGKPKGVLLSHQAMINRLLWMQEQFQLQNHEKVLHKTAISFDVSVWEIFWPLMQGATLVIAPPHSQKSAQELAKIIQQEQIQFVHFVPAMLGEFIDAASQCHSLRAVISSGEALHTYLAQRFLRQLTNTQLYNLYGPTEAAIDVSFYHCQLNDNQTPIGKPIANTELYICDAQQNLLPTGAVGEIIICGRNLAEGYLHGDEQQRFIQHPLYPEQRAYRSGDLGYFDENGLLHFVGRKDNQVKIRGFRIELNEIAQQLATHPDISDCHIAIEHLSSTDTRIIAYYISNKNEIPSQTLRLFLQNLLPSYMLPNHFVKVSRWPVNKNGKIATHLLSKDWQQTSHNNTLYPRDELEHAIYSIWADLLGVKNFGIEDDFFSLGGHSLLASQALTRIQQHFAVHIPLVEIFNQPTIANIAAAVRKQQEQKALIIDGPLQDGEQEFHL